MNVPQNLKYTKDHEWVLVEGDIATIGITDFAQGELGDIVYVEIETEGETLSQEEVFGSVEAVNSDPYGDGWMIKVKVSDASELNALMDAAAYSELIG